MTIVPEKSCMIKKLHNFWQFWQPILPQWWPHGNRGDTLWPQEDVLSRNAEAVLGEPRSNSLCLQAVHVGHFLPRGWAEEACWNVEGRETETADQEDRHKNCTSWGLLQCWGVSGYYCCLCCEDKIATRLSFHCHPEVPNLSISHCGHVMIHVNNKRAVEKLVHNACLL